MTRLRRKDVAKAIALLAIIVVALLIPVLATDPATTNIAVFTAMYVGLATAWNIMGGYTGYISLGHAAFFGFGAYALGLLLAHLGLDHVLPAAGAAPLGLDSRVGSGCCDSALALSVRGQRSRESGGSPLW